MGISVKKFQKTILDHYQKHGRKNLPWKKTRDPYKILVSEIMLQQTQVSRVLPKYREFLEAFPTLAALAKAPDAKLLKVWQGLGYWRRARYLKEAARMVVKDRTLSLLFKATSERSRPNSDTPRTQLRRQKLAGLEVYPAPKAELSGAGASEKVTLLKTLPGVGPYTAGAVACFAFGSSEPFIDTNIRRVYLHFFFSNKISVSDKAILKIAQQALYTKDPRTWHYALFDYGATVLKDRKINRRSRHYAKQSQFTGSFRSLRTSVVQLLLEQPHHTIPHKKLRESLQQQISAQAMSYSSDQVIDALLKDKLLKKTRTRYEL